MVLDLVSLFTGFCVGGAATGIAWHLTSRTTAKPTPTGLTGLWSLNELAQDGGRPGIMAERIDGILPPQGSKVIVPAGSLEAVDPELLMSCEVRMHPDVRLNAAVGKDRAIVFSGHLAPKATAVVTTDELLVRRLQMDFQRMWRESTPHVEELGLADLAHKEGRVVRTQGKVVEVMEYRGRKMLRITDGRVAVGVVTKAGDVSRWQGSVLRVTGRMHRDGGYPYIEADSVQLVQDAAHEVPA